MKKTTIAVAARMANMAKLDTLVLLEIHPNAGGAKKLRPSDTGECDIRH
jgi:hypothetical protein